MSRWWPERVLLRLPASASGRRDGAELLQAFEARLDALAPRRHARITAIVDDALLRPMLVPWNPLASSPARRQAYAEHCLREAYGDAARDWTVRVTRPAHGQPALACAFETEVLQQWTAAAARRGARLASVQPALVESYNRLRRGITTPDHWFVRVAPPTLTLMLMRRRAPQRVRTLAAGPGELATLLDREWFALGLDGERCPVHVAGAAADLPSASGDWPLVRWRDGA